MINLIVLAIFVIGFLLVAGTAIMEEYIGIAVLTCGLGIGVLILLIVGTRMNTIEQIEKYIPNLQEQIVEGKILELENKLESKNDNSKSN